MANPKEAKTEKSENLLSIEERLAAIRLQSAELELENLTYSVEQQRARREQIARTHKLQMEQIDEANRNIVAQQALCSHKKGGKGLAGILKGNSPNHSTNQHTYPWGEVVVICTRCGKEWAKPKVDLKVKDPALYKKQLTEYKEALEFETDNEPSGSQIFTITRGPQVEARA
jgi:hypothetical protein